MKRAARPRRRRRARAPPPPSAPPAPGAPPPQLWVDKFKPRTSKDLVGNKTAIETLRVWLGSW